MPGHVIVQSLPREPCLGGLRTERRVPSPQRLLVLGCCVQNALVLLVPRQAFSGTSEAPRCSHYARCLVRARVVCHLLCPTVIASPSSTQSSHSVPCFPIPFNSCTDPKTQRSRKWALDLSSPPLLRGLLRPGSHAPSVHCGAASFQDEKEALCSHPDPVRPLLLSLAMSPSVFCTQSEAVGRSPLLQDAWPQTDPHAQGVLESVVEFITCLAQPLSPPGKSVSSAICIYTSVSCFAPPLVICATDGGSSSRTTVFRHISTHVPLSDITIFS